MALRIDPRVPRVWRSPTAVQFGVDRPIVVLENVSNGDERMLAALCGGVPRSALSLIADAAGCAESRIDELLAALTPVLQAGAGTEPAQRPAARPRVVIDGDGPFAASVGSLLAAEGLQPHHMADWGEDSHVDLAVIVSDYVIAPERYGAWLRRDVPHLSVIAGDTTVRVGPLVEPGVGPCLYCLDLERVDQDSSWPAMAAQLLVRRSPVDSALVVAEVAAVTARAVLTRLRSGHCELLSSSMVIDTETGAVSVRGHRPHARCGCRALPENVTALARPRAAARSLPSSAEAPYEHG
jgi:bacteriocin biosynthesis cyclodehydratase domain-containing protein